MLPMQPDALSPYGPEHLGRHPRRPSGMHPFQIATGDENLVGPQLRDTVRGEIRAGDVVVFSHDVAKILVLFGRGVL